MNSTSTFPRVRTAAVIGAALVAAAAAAFVFTHQPARIAPQAAVVPVTAPLARPEAAQKLDLGAGYTLENGQIVAPASNFKPLPARIARQAAPVVPVTAPLARPEAVQKLDLGAGYYLENGQILAPASNFKPQPAGVQKIDLGGGYWLILSPDGTSQILH